MLYLRNVSLLIFVLICIAALFYVGALAYDAMVGTKDYSRPCNSECLVAPGGELLFP